MSVLGQQRLTLLDLAKSLNPDGTIAAVAELLHQTNEMLLDIPWIESNGPMQHTTTIRTGLPEPTWRLFNQGVQPTKSTKAQIMEAMGMVEDYAEIDKALADMSSNPAEFRLQESQAHIEGISQSVQGKILYGNQTTAPNEITGLANRYNSLSAQNARNVIDALGTGSDQTSIWLICWSPTTVHGLYPKGSVVGLHREDLKVATAENVNGVSGAKMQVYREHFQWRTGISVRDWRYAVRICNIDVPSLTTLTNAADIIQLMIKACHRIERLNHGKCAFYMNRTVSQMLDIVRRSDVISGGGLTYENVDGRMELRFRGIPIRIVDQILVAESQVT